MNKTNSLKSYSEPGLSRRQMLKLAGGAAALLSCSAGLMLRRFQPAVLLIDWLWNSWQIGIPICE
jgi:hypothetical protein